MKAMILAAGLGKRMRPLTNTTPKPLLRAGHCTLLDYHIERLLQLGIQDITLNTHWLADKISAHLEQHWRNQVSIHISHENELLETAGGIVKALPQLDSSNDEPFLLVNGDVYFDDSLTHWLGRCLDADCPAKAHILLTPNPEHNPNGDFGISPQSTLTCAGSVTTRGDEQNYTYCGIGLFRPSLFRELSPGPRPLGPILKDLSAQHALHASLIQGQWVDVGTPERLQELNQQLSL